MSNDTRVFRNEWCMGTFRPYSLLCRSDLDEGMVCGTVTLNWDAIFSRSASLG